MRRERESGKRWRSDERERERGGEIEIGKERRVKVNYIKRERGRERSVDSLSKKMLRK